MRGNIQAGHPNALDYIADGQPRRWENSQTGATGVLTPLTTFEHEGMNCRRLEMFNEVKGVTGRSVFVFCRQPDAFALAPHAETRTGTCPVGYRPSGAHRCKPVG